MPLRQPHERISHSLKFTYKKRGGFPFGRPLRFLFFTANFDGKAKSALCGGAASAPSDGFGFRAPL